MSQTFQKNVDNIKKNDNKFWELMHPSDMAYSITGLVNNEIKWKAKWEKTRKKRGRTAGQGKGEAGWWRAYQGWR